MDAFASFFESIYQPPSASSCSIGDHFSMVPNLSIIEVAETEIISVKKRLNSLIAGDDQIPSFLLRDCASVLAFPLKLILIR